MLSTAVKLNISLCMPGTRQYVETMGFFHRRKLNNLDLYFVLTHSYSDQSLFLTCQAAENITLDFCLTSFNTINKTKAICFCCSLVCEKPRLASMSVNIFSPQKRKNLLNFPYKNPLSQHNSLVQPRRLKGREVTAVIFGEKLGYRTCAVKVSLCYALH